MLLVGVVESCAAVGLGAPAFAPGLEEGVAASREPGFFFPKRKDMTEYWRSQAQVAFQCETWWWFKRESGLALCRNERGGWRKCSTMRGLGLSGE